MATTSSIDINELAATVSDLLTLVQGLVSKANRLPASSPPVAPPPVAPSLAPSFMPPITGIPANTSIRSLFPKVEAAVITAIITHELKATDLHKLDSKYHKEYKTPNSVIIPLQTYFAILQAHITTQNAKVNPHFYAYTAHLLKIASVYEWAGVLDYHIDFFNTRRTEMLEGNYTGWAEPDASLMTEHVFGRRKAAPAKASKASNPPHSTEPCRNFNLGTCTVTPCPWGRPHTCSTCGKHSSERPISVPFPRCIQVPISSLSRRALRSDDLPAAQCLPRHGRE